MIGKVKNLIRKQLHNRCYRKYLLETERQKDCYRQWYLANEDRKDTGARRPEKGLPSIGYPGGKEDILLFQFREGRLADGARTILASYFREHPEAELVYTDEDRLTEDNRRVEPWFKPGWSPDTFDAFCYFGSLVAIRRRWVEQYTAEETKTPEFLREAVRNITEHYLQEHKDIRTGQIPANEDKPPIQCLDRVLFHGAGGWDETDKPWERAESIKEKREEGEKDSSSVGQQPDRISIIIPSKDNPEVLETCLFSICNKTGLDSREAYYEIVVVDNGSSEENRRRMEELGKKYLFRYIYRPMEFNFSAMCNIGAGEANGTFYLFLNDDVEIIQQDWLKKLWETAKKPHVGAVGAKLLFPGGNLIQHAGVTNLDVGPAHKMLKADDKIPYYHGHNRFIYDMIGVTAACLMVRKEVFDEAEGFFEGIQVSYNDVDFCFKLYELGYYNVQRNDVSLYHHESLSRGDDNLSEDKWVRLLREKDILYQRHPKLRGYDPFYSRNLAQHTHEYGPNYQYEYEKRDRVTPAKRRKKPEPVKWENPCLVVNVEHARIQKKLDLSEKFDSFWIEGWSYVMGSDNALYDRRLLLIGKSGSLYELPVLTRYRKDVAEILPEQINVELSGFVCGIPSGMLPEDEYSIAMVARDCSSRIRLYTRTEATLEVSCNQVTMQSPAPVS